MDPKLFLTNKEVGQKYQNLRDQNYIYPYFYQINKNKKMLYYLGTQHVFDINDAQVQKIKELWNKFLVKTKKENCIVLTEGGDCPVEESEEVAIKRYGEPGLVTYLAAKESIKSLSPEPDEQYEIEELLKKFNLEEVMYSRFVRLVSQWHRMGKKPNFEKYLEGYLQYYRNKFGKIFDFSLENFIKLHNKLHEHPFDLDNYECFFHDENPGINPVSTLSSEIRNVHIVSEIIKLWDEGKNIFIVFGSGHAIVQEPALKHLIK